MKIKNKKKYWGELKIGKGGDEKQVTFLVGLKWFGIEELLNLIAPF